MPGQQMCYLPWQYLTVASVYEMSQKGALNSMTRQYSLQCADTMFFPSCSKHLADTIFILKHHYVLFLLSS